MVSEIAQRFPGGHFLQWHITSFAGRPCSIYMPSDLVPFGIPAIFPGFIDRLLAFLEPDQWVVVIVIYCQAEADFRVVDPEGDVLTISWDVEFCYFSTLGVCNERVERWPESAHGPPSTRTLTAFHYLTRL